MTRSGPGWVNFSMISRRTADSRAIRAGCHCVKLEQRLGDGVKARPDSNGQPAPSFPTVSSGQENCFKKGRVSV